MFLKSIKWQGNIGQNWVKSGYNHQTTYGLLFILEEWKLIHLNSSNNRSKIWRRFLIEFQEIRTILKKGNFQIKSGKNRPVFCKKRITKFETISGNSKPFDNDEKCFLFHLKAFFVLNPLSANITKWSNLPTNCLSVFDHFVILSLKGLRCLNFCSYVFGLVEERLEKTAKADFKIYDVTD